MKPTLTLALLLAGATMSGAENQSGTWSGHEAIDLGGGKFELRPVLITLKVNGAKVEGTAGKDEASQRPITASERPAEWLTFAAGSDTRFDLLIKGDRATGSVAREGTPGRNKVELKRRR